MHERGRPHPTCEIGPEAVGENVACHSPGTPGVSHQETVETLLWQYVIAAPALYCGKVSGLFNPLMTNLTSFVMTNLTNLNLQSQRQNSMSFPEDLAPTVTRVCSSLCRVDHSSHLT